MKKHLWLTLAALSISFPLIAQPADLSVEALHKRVIAEKATNPQDELSQAMTRELVGELYAVMDAFIGKDIERLAEHIHPKMVEFDSMSPFRDVGSASFLEHMALFFASPEHIEDHFVRIKEPLVQVYGGDTAIVTFMYDTEASVGGNFVQNYGKASFVFVKDPALKSVGLSEKWMLTLCHYSTLRPSLR
jgi:ketosteroid isomerase-like protein